VTSDLVCDCAGDLRSAGLSSRTGSVMTHNAAGLTTWLRVRQHSLPSVSVS
jgi:hypothetical protein